MSQALPPQQNPYAAGKQPPPGYENQPMGQGGMPYDPHNQGDATGGIIPYKNPKALIAYYCGIVGLLPLIGLPIAIAAFVLGILGLRDRKRNPVIKGSVHAWIGIVLGFIATAYNTLMVVGLIAGLLSGM